MRRYKYWAHKINSWKYLTIWRPVLPVFLWAQNASSLFSTLNSFQGVLKIRSCSTHDLILVEGDGKCQFVVDKCFLLSASLFPLSSPGELSRSTDSWAQTLWSICLFGGKGLGICIFTPRWFFRYSSWVWKYKELVAQLCPSLCELMAPLAMEFSRQKYSCGWPFPSLRDLPNPGIFLT